jgi:hypothetical protein
MLSSDLPGRGPRSLFRLLRLTKPRDALPVGSLAFVICISRINSFGSPVMIVTATQKFVVCRIFPAVPQPCKHEWRIGLHTDSRSQTIGSSPRLQSRRTLVFTRNHDFRADSRALGVDPTTLARWGAENGGQKAGTWTRSGNDSVQNN